MTKNKQEIRRRIMEERDRIDPQKKAEWDRQVFEGLIRSDFYQNAAVIFAFASFGSEVDTHRFLEHALKNGKKVCLPKVLSKKQGLEFYFIKDLQDLEAGLFGILEPKECCQLASHKEVDLILIPGLAFDGEGGRIGYGGGFYDRYLLRLSKNVPKIAIAYDFQVIDKVPTDEFDLPIDGIITNKGIRIFKEE